MTLATSGPHSTERPRGLSCNAAARPALESMTTGPRCGIGHGQRHLTLATTRGEGERETKKSLTWFSEREEEGTGCDLGSGLADF